LPARSPVQDVKQPIWASWFETHGLAVLLTMKVRVSRRLCSLILRAAFSARLEGWGSFARGDLQFQERHPLQNDRIALAGLRRAQDRFREQVDLG
jgi:hypothetical protein